MLHNISKFILIFLQFTRIRSPFIFLRQKADYLHFTLAHHPLPPYRSRLRHGLRPLSGHHYPAPPWPHRRLRGPHWRLLGARRHRLTPSPCSSCGGVVPPHRRLRGPRRRLHGPRRPRLLPGIRRHAPNAGGGAAMAEQTDGRKIKYKYNIIFLKFQTKSY